MTGSSTSEEKDVQPRGETEGFRGDWASAEIQKLLDQMLSLRDHICQAERDYAGRIEKLIDNRKASAKNLVQYVALRQQDLRSLQEDLLRRGLSSLGRCESNVHATLNCVIDVLCRLSGQSPCSFAPVEVSFSKSRELLKRATDALFGHQPGIGAAHIMVTMPSEAARDRTLISGLVAQGMDCMRINCAHDQPSEWQQMIVNLRHACGEQHRECKVLMDLAGPKLRTGPIEQGPAVVKWRPRRDKLGRVMTSARIWLREEGSTVSPPLPATASIPVAAEWFKDLRPGDQVRFDDARGRHRVIRIVGRTSRGVWGETDKTAYVVPNTKIFRRSSDGTSSSEPGRIGAIGPSEQSIVLHQGDRLILGDSETLGSLAKYDQDGQVIFPATIGCTLPEVFRDLKRGDRVLLDDGKIAASVEQIDQQYAELTVISASPTGTKLRSDKGINLPDTRLHLDALTKRDIADLQFVVEHADMVGYSFVRTAEDVEQLQSELARLGRPEMPIVLKIENRQAFDHLPSLLLTAMRSPISGVMIARGDLAVELGWQRLAEVQEEILWMCEAAHMPVIWATQVLDNLAKTGIPSRAEITDAAMSVRAECVMLNKGPHILEAVRLLVDILGRMQDHQIKKRPLLRRLHLADDLMPTEIAKPAMTAMADLR
ncbi:MAG: pyruvate kinase [Pirellulaceae bacterium]|nr:pyruvate kinase [Pirellulaceae bacterium]